ncbi:MAG: hypothetical protein LBM17_06450 [Candidatus Accumulibacter sp.]|jgi:hypothetical protein|nr:hypothetical protein [Accumulibacter sp.]
MKPKTTKTQVRNLTDIKNLPPVENFSRPLSGKRKRAGSTWGLFPLPTTAVQPCRTRTEAQEKFQEMWKICQNKCLILVYTLSEEIVTPFPATEMKVLEV